FVLGIADGAKATAWNFRDLNRAPVMHVQWQGEPAVVVFDRRSVTARMYSRKLGQRTLTFEMKAGKLTDKETGSTWEPVTGQALTGPLKDQHLTAQPAIVSFRETWLNFHPNSEVKPSR